tara:strand:- start:1188 stop:2198 length:1011 start_codon:yes stop_codon:yes gene_type:complete
MNIGTKLLLEKKIKSLPQNKRKDFLINCISQYIDLKPTEDEYTDIESTKKDNKLFCKICNQYEFIRTTYNETCNNCGYIRNLVGGEKKYEKVEYIKRGANIIRTIQDGKMQQFDLNKIDSWLQERDPMYPYIKQILEKLDIIYSNVLHSEQIQDVKNMAISLLYNYNSKNNGIRKTNEILSLCTYYGILLNKNSSHKYNVSIQQISLLFDTTVSNIEREHFKFKMVFKDTDYYNDLNLQEKKKCDIELKDEYNDFFSKLENNLKENQIIKDLDNNNTAAIIYYINKKILIEEKIYTLKFLSEKCLTNTTAITKMVKIIEKFYAMNPNELKKIGVNN